MKAVREFVVSTLVGGIFIVVPVYLALVLLLKGMQSAARLVKPFAAMVPDWVPAETFFSLLLVLLVCFLVGAAVRTKPGGRFEKRWRRCSSSGFPGTACCGVSPSAWPGTPRRARGSRPCQRSRMRWSPRSSSKNLRRTLHGVRAIHPDTVCRGRLRACAGTRDPVDVPFTQAVRTISRWGSGSGEMVAAMRSRPSGPAPEHAYSWRDRRVDRSRLLGPKPSTGLTVAARQPGNSAAASPTNASTPLARRIIRALKGLTPNSWASIHRPNAHVAGMAMDMPRASMTTASRVISHSAAAGVAPSASPPISGVRCVTTNDITP